MASNLRAIVLLGQAFFKQKGGLKNNNNSADQKLNIDLSSVVILLSSSGSLKISAITLLFLFESSGHLQGKHGALKDFKWILNFFLELISLRVCSILTVKYSKKYCET